MNFIRTVMLCVLVFVCSFTLQPISVGISSGTHLAPQPATVSMVLEAVVLPLFRPLTLELVMPALRGTLYRYNLPDATNLAAAVLVFLIVMYFQGFRAVLPVRSKNTHGQQGSYPFNLLCMSNMPITDLYFVSKLLYRNYSEIFMVNLLGKGMD